RRPRELVDEALEAPRLAIDRHHHRDERGGRGTGNGLHFGSLSTRRRAGRPGGRTTSVRLGQATVSGSECLRLLGDQRPSFWYMLRPCPTTRPGCSTRAHCCWSWAARSSGRRQERISEGSPSWTHSLGSRSPRATRPP